MPAHLLLLLLLYCCFFNHNLHVFINISKCTREKFHMLPWWWRLRDSQLRFKVLTQFPETAFWNMSPWPQRDHNFLYCENKYSLQVPTTVSCEATFPIHSRDTNISLYVGCSCKEEYASGYDYGVIDKSLPWPQHSSGNVVTPDLQTQKSPCKESDTQVFW